MVMKNKVIHLKSCVGVGYNVLITKYKNILKKQNRDLNSSKNFVLVNGKFLEQYFNNNNFLIDIVYFPIKICSLENSGLRFSIRIKGGGKTGQAKTIRQLISYLLLEIDPKYKITLNKYHLLTLDKRRKESKKIGLKRARRSRQFTKR